MGAVDTGEEELLSFIHPLLEPAMNLIRPALCLAVLAFTPAAFALELCPLQVPSLTPSLPNIPPAPQVQPAPAAAAVAAPARAMPAPARAVRVSCNNADGEPFFFHTLPYVPTVAMSGDDDGCIPRPVKPVHRPHLDPQCIA